MQEPTQQVCHQPKVLALSPTLSSDYASRVEGATQDKWVGLFASTVTVTASWVRIGTRGDGVGPARVGSVLSGVSIDSGNDEGATSLSFGEDGPRSATFERMRCRERSVGYRPSRETKWRDGP